MVCVWSELEILNWLSWWWVFCLCLGEVDVLSLMLEMCNINFSGVIVMSSCSTWCCVMWVIFILLFLKILFCVGFNVFVMSFMSVDLFVLFLFMSVICVVKLNGCENWLNIVGSSAAYLNVILCSWMFLLDGSGLGFGKLNLKFLVFILGVVSFFCVLLYESFYFFSSCFMVFMRFIFFVNFFVFLVFLLLNMDDEFLCKCLLINFCICFFLVCCLLYIFCWCVFCLFCMVLYVA